MGTPAYCTGYAMFETEAEAKTALPLFEAWAEKANNGELPEPDNSDFGIHDVCQDFGGEDTLRWGLESARYQNCVWQAERVREFLQKQPGCFQVEQDVMTIEESVNWYSK